MRDDVRVDDLDLERAALPRRDPVRRPLYLGALLEELQDPS